HCRTRPLVVAKMVANSPWQRAQHAYQQIQLTTRLIVANEAEPAAQLAKDVGVRARLADRVDHRAPEVDVQRTVGLGEVVPLEKRRRREDDVREERRVG